VEQETFSKKYKNKAHNKKWALFFVLISGLINHSVNVFQDNTLLLTF
jgi:hypothetical protein